MSDAQEVATRQALVDTLQAVVRLREALDRAEFHAVRSLRSMGMTWEEVGEELGGISRQAARTRFGKQQRRYTV